MTKPKDRAPWRSLESCGKSSSDVKRNVSRSASLFFIASGEPLRSFRRQWQSAAVAARLGTIHKDESTGKESSSGITPHDMRRSGIRNLMKSGVSEAVGMSISAHRTNSTYKRYGIIDEDLQRKALQSAQRHQQRETAKRKVVPMRQVG